MIAVMQDPDHPEPVPPEETTTPPHGDPLAPGGGDAPERPPAETPGLPRTEDSPAAPDRVPD
jgi:hypothetical protein